MNIEKSLGAALVLLGGGGIAIASQISVRTFNNDPGPKLFPIFACAILLICGLGLLFQRASAETPSPIGRAEVQRGVTMAALLVGFGICLWLFGFHIASFLVVFGLYWVMAAEDRALWRGLVAAVLVTGGVHLLFAVGLGAFLPRGIIFAGF